MGRSSACRQQEKIRVELVGRFLRTYVIMPDARDADALFLMA
jgi:hypothetical protein